METQIISASAVQTYIAAPDYGGNLSASVEPEGVMLCNVRLGSGEFLNLPCSERDLCRLIADVLDDSEFNSGPSFIDELD